MGKRKVWHLEVPVHLDKQLEDYIGNSVFKTKSEFIFAWLYGIVLKRNAKSWRFSQT